MSQRAGRSQIPRLRSEQAPQLWERFTEFILSDMRFFAGLNMTAAEGVARTGSERLPTRIATPSAHNVSVNMCYNTPALVIRTRHATPGIGLSEMGLQSIGKLVILAGTFLVVFGVLLVFWQRIPFLGKLPGDIFLQKGNLQFFFPIVTCLAISALLTIVVNLIVNWLK